LNHIGSRDDDVFCYFCRLLSIVASYNADYIVWQEVFDNKVKVTVSCPVQTLWVEFIVSVQTWDQQNSFRCLNEFSFEFSEFGLHREFMNELN